MKPVEPFAMAMKIKSRDQDVELEHYKGNQAAQRSYISTAFRLEYQVFRIFFGCNQGIKVNFG